ncbi:MAG: hypothetical protein Q4G52_06470 [Clostridia bacterium]|nr:hypothetical protein [Clostridia bacterium]
MDYACPTDRAFITKKQIKRTIVLSDDTKARRAYIAQHRVSVSWNPSTQEYEVSSSEKEHV